MFNTSTALHLLNEHREACDMPRLDSWNGTYQELLAELARVEHHAEYGDSAWNAKGQPLPIESET